MSKPRGIVLAGLLAVGVAAGIWFAKPAAGPADSTAMPSGAPPERAVAAQPEMAPRHSDLVSAATTPELASPLQQPTLGFGPTVFLADLPPQLDDLARRAQAGDARALTDVAEWTDYCDRAHTHAVLSTTGTTRGDLADTAVAAYFKAIDSSCADWRARHAWLTQAREEALENARASYARRRAGITDALAESLPKTAPDLIRRRAADAGDAIALALRPDSSAREACRWSATSPITQRQIANQCLHELARERLAIVLQSGDPRLIETVPRIMMAYNINSLGANEYFHDGYAGESEIRWTLVACQMGLDCGPTARALRWACAEGHCGYRHYRDYAADQRLPPARMRAVDGQVSRLLALIQSQNVDAILGPARRW